VCAVAQLQGKEFIEKALVGSSCGPVTIKALKECSGSANTWIVRGKRRHGFDYAVRRACGVSLHVHAVLSAVLTPIDLPCRVEPQDGMHTKQVIKLKYHHSTSYVISVPSVKCTFTCGIIESCHTFA